MKTTNKWFKYGCSAWNDPQQLSLKVLLGLTYFAGLLAFHRYSNLLSETTRNTNLQDLKLPQYNHRIVRALLQVPENETENLTNVTDVQTNGTLVEELQYDPLFPKDIFTMTQIKNGAVAFYILGVIYMFVALTIVCDEFFVPSIDVIIEKLGCSEDVAGATFMAAGGSAPELFTSAIGVFIAFSNVGIGTIVGSAVFNILFVIGMCALFSKTVLCLTWWPLLRDCTFYSISLITLIVFFIDEEIEWWEALILLTIYGSYVYFMKWNVKAEVAFKKLIGAKKVGQSPLMNNEQLRQGYTGVPVLHSGSLYHGGLLQLMVYTIDPMGDKVDEKAAQLYNIAAVQSSMKNSANGGLNGSLPNGPETSIFDEHFNEEALSRVGVPYTANKGEGAASNGVAAGTAVGVDQGEADDNAPMDLSWPATWPKRLAYMMTLPLVLPLWLTLPDTRKQESRKYFIITFTGSILWIAVFSYLMVWWATITGNAFSIPPEVSRPFSLSLISVHRIFFQVMGLTFLAAGTSIPDLFTSIIVARKGFGDMAVSSSVGSNIFDVTVGLPLPWLLYTLAFGVPVPVSSAGMICSIAILFCMLIMVFFSILIFNWKMTRGMGLSMFGLYFVFVFFTLGFEYDFYDCPI